MLKKIVSGGQTGADRAALDIAMERGLEIGGWIPKGRLAEAGRYHLATEGSLRLTLLILLSEPLSTFETPTRR